MAAEVFEYTGGGLRGAAIIGAFRKLGVYGGAALEIRRFGTLEQAQACPASAPTFRNDNVNVDRLARDGSPGTAPPDA